MGLFSGDALLIDKIFILFHCGIFLKERMCSVFHGSKQDDIEEEVGKPSEIDSIKSKISSKTIREKKRTAQKDTMKNITSEVYFSIRMAKYSDIYYL